MAHSIKLTAQHKKLLQSSLAERSEQAVPVIRKLHKSGKTTPDPLRGAFETRYRGARTVVDYEPDSELRETEEVPLLEEGGIEAYMRREVLPHVADAWYDPDSLKVGYEVSFNHYFYRPQPLRPLDEIRGDIVSLQEETEGLLSEIVMRGRE